MFRINHSFDRVPTIHPRHVTFARQLYEIHGGKTVSGLTKALAAANRRNAPRPVVVVLQQLLEIERSRADLRLRRTWRPMR